MDANNRFMDADERRALLGYKYDTSEPLCKFGPGGDFVSYWPPKPGMRPSTLTDLLNKLIPIVKAAAAQQAQPHQSNIMAASTDQKQHIISPKEQFGNEASRDPDDKPANAPTATIINGDTLFSGQQMLFPDDSRTRRPAKHKPKHRLRAHRRTAKKTLAAGLPGQGSLFEADFKSAKTA